MDAELAEVIHLEIEKPSDSADYYCDYQSVKSLTIHMKSTQRTLSITHAEITCTAGSHWQSPRPRIVFHSHPWKNTPPDLAIDFIHANLPVLVSEAVQHTVQLQMSIALVFANCYHWSVEVTVMTLIGCRPGPSLPDKKGREGPSDSSGSLWGMEALGSWQIPRVPEDGYREDTRP